MNVRETMDLAFLGLPQILLLSFPEYLIRQCT